MSDGQSSREHAENAVEALSDAFEDLKDPDRASSVWYAVQLGAAITHALLAIAAAIEDAADRG